MLMGTVSHRRLNQDNPSQKTPLTTGLSMWMVLSFMTLFCLVIMTSARAEAATANPSVKVKSSHIDVKEVKSNKGITAWLVEEHDIPVVSVAIAFKKAGSSADPKGLSGMSELIASTLDEGSGSLNSQEFKKYLLKNNIQLTLNATQDFFSISFRTVTKNINEAFEILKNMLSLPLFDAAALTRVKNQMSSALEQSLHSENTIASQTLTTTLYGEHPYGITIQQTLKELPKITAVQMHQFMKERLARDQLIISIVGDINAAEVKKILDKTFEVLPEKATPLSIPDVVLPPKGRVVTVPLDIPQAVILFTQPGVTRTDPDFYAAYVLIKILGEDSISSRLMDELRGKGGLIYGIFADLNYSKHAALIMGHTATKNSTVKEVISRIRKVWADTIQGITQNELDAIKKRVIGSFAIKFSSTIDIAKALMIYQFDNLGLDYINKRNNIISTLTLADINKVAKSLLNPEQLTFVVVGDPKELSAQNLTQENKPGVVKS
jgi:zinc protease